MPFSKPKREVQIDSATGEKYDAPDGFIPISELFRGAIENDDPCPLYVSPKYAEWIRSTLPTTGERGKKAFMELLVSLWAAWSTAVEKACPLPCCKSPRGNLRIHIGMELVHGEGCKCGRPGGGHRADLVLSSEGTDGRRLRGATIVVWEDGEYKEV